MYEKKQRRKPKGSDGLEMGPYLGFASLYSSVSVSSSSEYSPSVRPPAMRPRAARSPAALPYPVYFTNRDTVERKEDKRGHFLLQTQ